MKTKKCIIVIQSYLAALEADACRAQAFVLSGACFPCCWSLAVLIILECEITSAVALVEEKFGYNLRQMPKIKYKMQPSALLLSKPITSMADSKSTQLTAEQWLYFFFFLTMHFVFHFGCKVHL